ncbi:MAG: hypothetical protein Q9166_000452 [cf. Caloplaca sp. 2 TL-2023]
MVKRTLAPLTPQGKLRDWRSYSTMDSDNSLTSETSGSRQEAKQQANAWNTGRYTCFCMIIFVFSILVWKFSPTSSSEYSVALPSPSPAHHQFAGQDPQYLWLVEHDTSANDGKLATLKSLYGCASLNGAWTWNLVRADYADLALEDIFRIPGLYQGVVEADMIYCERKISDSVPPSQTRECRVVGNSHFSQNTNLLHWPTLKTFDVTANFSLAFRPSFEGKHRVKPCICQDMSPGAADVTIKIQKPARRLSIQCSKSIVLGSDGPSPWKDDLAQESEWRTVDAMSDNIVPGLYVVPDHQVLGYRWTAVRNKTKLEDVTKHEEIMISNTALGVATRTARSLRYLDQHFACTFCRLVGSGCCAGHVRRDEVAILPTSGPQGILPAGTSPERPVKSNFKGLYAASGVLAFISFMALAGWLVRRRSSRPAAETPNAHLATSGHERSDLNDQTISEEPEGTSASEVDGCLWYVCLWKRVKVISPARWGKWLSGSFTKKESQAVDAREVEKGNCPRKLHKKKGTGLEDPTDMSVRIMSPTSAMSVNGGEGDHSSMTMRPADRTNDHMNNDSAYHVDGSSTAQEHGIRSAATRRSNHNSTFPDRNDESP